MLDFHMNTPVGSLATLDIFLIRISEDKEEEEEGEDDDDDDDD